MVRQEALTNFDPEEIAVDLSTEKPSAKTFDIYPTTEDKEQVPPEIREFVTLQGLQIMRDVFKNRDDYAVFASTAKYLIEKKTDQTWKTTPGDFDVTLADESGLREIRTRLSNVPGVRFKNNGEFKRFPDDALVLQGSIDMEHGQGDPPVVSYPFEIFANNSRIVPEEIRQESVLIDDLRILKPDAIQNQYLNNLALETRSREASVPVAAFLREPAVASQILEELDALQFDPEHPISDTVSQISHKLQLSEEDLRAFYEETERIGAASKEVTPAMVKILSGNKDKIQKRLRDIADLQNMTSLGEIDQKDPPSAKNMEKSKRDIDAQPASDLYGKDVEEKANLR